MSYKGIKNTSLIVVGVLYVPVIYLPAFPFTSCHSESAFTVCHRWFGRHLYAIFYLGWGTFTGRPRLGNPSAKRTLTGPPHEKVGAMKIEIKAIYFKKKVNTETLCSACVSQKD